MSRLTRFDPMIHAPHRLRICALLADIKELEFATLRDTLSVSDSVLSKLLSVLAQAGYVRSRPAKRDTRQRAWLALTPEGRDRYKAHVAALRDRRGHHGGAAAWGKTPSRRSAVRRSPLTAG